MPRKKKAAQSAFPEHFYYDGILQVGDCRLWNEKNLHAYLKLVHTPLSMVGPGDIVDTIEPKKQYTFYLYVPSATDDAARELDRLRRAKYLKCDAGRFASPTEKFETSNGVLVLGRGIWYACPKAQMDANRSSADEAMQLIASAHSNLAEMAKKSGYESVVAQTRNDLRGQRLTK